MANEAKVEVLKVWYSVFCTLVDAYSEGEMSHGAFVAKMVNLRRKLVDSVPEVEAEMAKHKN